MKIISITYCNDAFKKAAKLNIKTAKRIGKVDTAIQYGPDCIDSVFYETNKTILQQRRGNGYWLWKPYFILETLKKCDDGDIVIYSDSAIYYIHPVAPLIQAMEQNNDSAMFFSLGNERIEAEYTKRDAFVLLNCDTEKYADTPQIDASFIVLKNSEAIRAFVSEWLEACCDERILTDIDNELNKPNYSTFKMHRHDQSILSLLVKKYDYRLYRSPSQWGNIQVLDSEILTRSQYGQIVNHHRMRNGGTVFMVRFNQLDIVKNMKHNLWRLRQGESIVKIVKQRIAKRK